MGAQPKRKLTRRLRGFRRQHQTLEVPQLVSCKSCGQQRRPHHACLYCGKYNGRQALKVGGGEE